LAYPGNRLPTFAGGYEATGHAATFPVGLPAFFIKAYSDPGDAIFDPFLGSGSTLVAAQLDGRAGYGCEISPGYVDVACRRLQKASGVVPVLATTGESHDFIDQLDQ
jgi:DNA modification methylase